MNDQNEPGNRKLRDLLHIAPDGRQIHHWRGRARKDDIEELTEAIAATGEIFNRDNTLVRITGDGKLVSVNLAGLAEFITEHICGVRVVVNQDEVARKEYFTYEFGPAPPVPPPTWATGLPRSEKESREPDDKALREIYLTELLKRIPPVQT